MSKSKTTDAAAPRPDVNSRGRKTEGGLKPPDNSLYNKHRPKTLDDVVGQDAAVKLLRGMLAKSGPPHALLIVGGSGTGKTTIAAILAGAVGCPESSPEYSEINCAICDPMDTVREIQKSAPMSPMFSRSKVWILDEFQSLSRAGHAQQALLKVIEKAKPFCYFFLCSTDPGKIIPTIRNRCTNLQLRPVPHDDLRKLVRRVAKAEGSPLDAESANRLASLADGSPRKALVMLEAVLTLDGDADWDEVLKVASGESAAIDLSKALLNPRSNWATVASVLKGLRGQDAEQVRLAVAGYASQVLLNSGSRRAYAVLQAFREPYLMGGYPLLAADSFQAVHSK